MWKLALVGALLGIGGGTVLGQTGGGPVGFDWGSMLGGAIGSSPAAAVLFWRLTKADVENTRLRDEVRDLHLQTVGVAERMAPILADATRTLNEVRNGLEATYERGNRAADDGTDLVIRRLERVLKDFQHGRQDDR